MGPWQTLTLQGLEGRGQAVAHGMEEEEGGSSHVCILPSVPSPVGQCMFA